MAPPFINSISSASSPSPIPGPGAPFRISRDALDHATWFPRDEYPFPSRYLDLPGGAMHYLDEGRGPPILLVHGTPSWSFEFRGVISRLQDRHRCVAPDHLGFGLSDRPGEVGLLAHADNLARFVERSDLDDIHLVVHDFGGPIALPLLETHPARIARVTILNSWFWPFEDVDPSFAKQKKWLETRLMRFLYLRANFSARMMVKRAWGTRAPLDRPRHAQYKNMFPTAESRRSTWALLQAVLHSSAYYTAHAGVLDRLRSLPVQLVWGTADPFIHERHLARWRALLPAAHVVELAGVGHFVADEAADDVATALDSFLSPSPAPASSSPASPPASSPASAR
jgi:haloalkane dehalogenase